MARVRARHVGGDGREARARIRADLPLIPLCGVGRPCATVSSLESFDPGRGILLQGTVVTMDDAGTVIPQGNVLVRDKKIIAVW